jgi:tetratricopeptide (TPR) repeat protein
MEAKILAIAASIGTPLGLAGLAVGILYLLYKRILGQKLSRILPEHTFLLFNRLATYLFCLALTAMLLGVASYLVIHLYGSSSGPNPDALKLEQEAGQHVLQGYYSLALKDANELVRLSPKDPVGYKLKGHAHYKLHEYSSALQAFQDALNIDPNFSAALFGKGATLTALGNYVEAKAIFERLTDMDPSDMSVRYNLAGLQLLTANYPAAKESYALIYNSGGEYKAETAVGLGISGMLSEMASGGSPPSPQAGAQAVSFFKEAVCLKPELRGIFVGSLGEDIEENYDGYRTLLRKFDQDPIYEAFLNSLRSGKVC